MKKNYGFTLIEIMIVVSILGVLSAILVPKMGNIILRAKETHVRNNLGVLRSALRIYTADTAQIPTDPNDVFYSSIKYLNKFPNDPIPAVPSMGNPGHPPHTGFGPIMVGPGPVIDQFENHFYFFDSGPYTGTIVIDCYHLDSKGLPWSTY